MSEIEKLYELANIEPFIHYQPVKDYNFGGDNGYKYNKVKYYPPFTAEKQLEIVKQILFSTWWMNLKRLQFSEKFDEGLAQMINELWQDLTPEEKQQVKGILE